MRETLIYMPTAILSCPLPELLRVKTKWLMTFGGIHLYRQYTLVVETGGELHVARR